MGRKNYMGWHYADRHGSYLYVVYTINGPCGLDRNNLRCLDNMEKRIDFQITPSAIKRIQSLQSKNETSQLLRVSVEGGGCQGFSYKFGFDANTSDDLIVQDIVIIDPTSLKFLKGAELDYAEDLLGSYFRVQNPVAESTCGCGTSFSV